MLRTGKQITNDTKLSDEHLPKLASELNKQLPMVVDRETRLDSTLGGPGKRLTYLYTATNYNASQINVSEFTKQMSPQLRNGVCSSSDMNIFVRSGVTIIYSYRAKDGRHFAKIEVNPSECTK